MSADAHSTKYQFANSYSGVPQGFLSGMAGYYHATGGWNAETDRRASKRAEGLQMFKDYVNTLTENGIVPNQDSLNAFLGQAGDFGLNASYGFDPYATQQLMESAIKQGEQRKKEIEAKNLQTKLENAERIRNDMKTLVAQSGGNEEKLNKEISTRYEGWSPEEVQSYKDFAIQSFGADFAKTLDTLAGDSVDRGIFDSLQNQYKGAPGYAKTAIENKYNANVNKAINTVVTKLDPMLANVADENKVRNMIVAELPEPLKNDNKAIERTLQIVKGASTNKQAQLASASAEDLTKNFSAHSAKVAELAVAEEERKRAEEEKLIERQKSDAVARTKSKEKEKEQYKAEKNLDKKALVYAKIDAKYDYDIQDSDLKSQIESAESTEEINKLIATGLKTGTVFSQVEMDSIELREQRAGNKSRDWWTADKVYDYQKITSIRSPLTTNILGGLKGAIEKNKAGGLSYDSQLDKAAELLAREVGDWRAIISHGTPHDYSAQELGELEGKTMRALLTSAGYTDVEQQAIFSRLKQNRLVAPPMDIPRNLTMAERYVQAHSNTLRSGGSALTGNILPYGMGFPNQPNASQPFNPSAENTGNPGTGVKNQGAQPLVSPTPNNHSLWDAKTSPAEPGKEGQSPSVPQAWNDFNTNLQRQVVALQKGNVTPEAQYVYQAQRQEDLDPDNNRFKKHKPSKFYQEAMKADNKHWTQFGWNNELVHRLASEAEYMNGLPTGMLRAVLECEATYSDETPLGQNSTAKGMVQITDTTARGRTRLGDVAHNRLNTAQNLDKGGQILREAYEMSDGDLYATFLQYKAGTAARKQYLGLKKNHPNMNPLEILNRMAKDIHGNGYITQTDIRYVTKAIDKIQSYPDDYLSYASSNQAFSTNIGVVDRKANRFGKNIGKVTEDSYYNRYVQSGGVPPDRPWWNWYEASKIGTANHASAIEGAYPMNIWTPVQQREYVPFSWN